MTRRNVVVSVLLWAAVSTGATSAETRFERLDSARTGVSFRHLFIPADYQSFKEHYSSAEVGGGVALGDYDDDGLVDLYLTRPSGGGRLYRNLGDFRFEDVTSVAGIADDFWSVGATFADFDDDGDCDLFVCGFRAPNRLYQNQGDGSFRDVATQANVDLSIASIQLAFADADLDGDLDGYLVTYTRARGSAPLRPQGETACPFPTAEVARRRPVGFTSATDAMAAESDVYFRNDSTSGEIRFHDQSVASGIEGNWAGLAAVWWDKDDDGDPDLYVANDFHGPDRLYENQRDGTFVDVACSALPRTPWYSMGVDVADVDGDGRVDLFATDMAGRDHIRQKLSMGEMESWFLELPTPRQVMRNALFLNSGVQRFREGASLAGIDRTDWTWSVRFADFDNDGREDLFVANGMTADWYNRDLAPKVMRMLAEPRPIELDLKRDPDRFYRNVGGVEFEDVGDAWGASRASVSFGAATADLDNDGYVDLVVNHFFEPVGIYRNRGGDAKSISLRLRGTASNRDGAGATIRLTTPLGSQVRYVSLARGYASSGDATVHFGLGTELVASRVEVAWPSGRVQTLLDVVAGTRRDVVEPDGDADSKEEPPMTAAASTMFNEWGGAGQIEHVERPHDDFVKQPLLPMRQSRFGPGLAVSDVDGDGRDDLYLGGAAGSVGAFWLSRADGTWEQQRPAVFETSRESEDLGALFFDADADGDDDLYVVSGGVEATDRATLRDRLYLRDGADWRLASEALPKLAESGSVVCAADFDRDGDLDLFIGGRTSVDDYPNGPPSRLLRNVSTTEAARFVDVTQEVAPALLGLDRVSSAIWSDLDGDGFVDLAIAREWGRVELLLNRAGEGMVIRDQPTGPSLPSGWWNGIAAGDVDNDGDVDLVVTNYGLNTTYRASVEYPHQLFIGKFDREGATNLIEASYEGETLYPVRGRSCASAAIPGLGEKFPTFASFATATVEELFSSEQLSAARRLQIETLESSLFLNQGDAEFVVHPLPRIAQIAPAFGVVLVDVDGDRNLDLYLAQNFSGPQPETGPMNGGVGQLLLGDGRGNFDPVDPAASRLVVPEDGRSVGVVDLDRNGVPDLIVATSDGPVHAFRSILTPRFVRLDLRGAAGNPTAVGARVVVSYPDGEERSFEAFAGGGYLSQSGRGIFVPWPDTDTPLRIGVRWPNGEESAHYFTFEEIGRGRRATLRFPAASR